MASKVDGLTPMRRQYLALKRQYPDAILFFRLGDFYETFDADAELVARVLHITLTSREVGKGQRVPLAGVPYHAVEGYLARLLAAGHKVAICEQLDAEGRPTSNALGPADARPGHKGMLRREVVRVVTPGTVVEPRLLDARRNNFLCALVAEYGPQGTVRFGLAHADVTTGEFATTELHGEESPAELARELDRLRPAECLIPGIGGRGSEVGGADGLSGVAFSPGAGVPHSPPSPAEGLAPAPHLGEALVASVPPPPPSPSGGGSPAAMAGDAMITALLLPPAGGAHRQRSNLPLKGEGSVASLEELATEGRNVTYVEPWRFELATAQETLCRLFGVTSLAGFGCAHLPLATRAAGALVAYVEQTHRQALALFDGLSTYEPGGYMRLDGFTRRNLELVDEALAPRADGTPRPTLVSVIDETRTAMGGRLLRRWLGQPLLDVAALTARQEVVAALVEDGVQRERLRALLGRVADIGRLTSRVRQGAAHPRDLLALRASLLAAGEIKAAAGAEALARLVVAIDPCPEVAALIERAVYVPDERAGRPPKLATWEEERLIRAGYSQELDDLIEASASARRWIANLESVERERTGIKSLRVGFNKVFGYYLHVSHAYKGEIPPDYIRRQTLADGERYITTELKEYENRVLGAQERISALERQLFGELQREIAAQATRLTATAAALAELDVLAGFAEVAVRRGYVRPALDEGETIEITQGRHPVVEAALAAATTQVGQPAAFVPNDCRLSASEAQILILTGPNMSGKSTFLRSVALLVLLAQTGSFVPAAAARIGVVDRLFTRVGAQDDLAAGQSTFMVEMVETASILRHATRRSLVVLDEIGRGTSTYDGVAIAQAVVEYLHQWAVGSGQRAGSEADEGRRTKDEAPVLSGAERREGDHGAVAPGGPRTLFATHYHELADLEGVLPRVRNFRVDVLEEGDRVVFLHRVVPGSADRSYGIHVARLAGVPRPVTQRAQAVLAALEAGRGAPPASPPAAAPDAPAGHGAPGAELEPPTSDGATGGNTLAARLGQLGRTGGRGFIRVPANGHGGQVLARAPRPEAAPSTLSKAPAPVQLTLFAPSHPIVDELKAMDILTMTPLEALNRLADLIRRAKEE